METIINNPGNGSGEGSGLGMILGVLLAVVLIALFFIYVLPSMRGADNNNGSLDINLDLPSGGNSNEGSAN